MILNAFLTTCSIWKHFTLKNIIIEYKYVLSTMGVSKESISKFLIGNRFHVKLRILSPYSNRMFFKHFKPYSNRSWTFRLVWVFPCCDNLSLGKCLWGSRYDLNVHFPFTKNIFDLEHFFFKPSSCGTFSLFEMKFSVIHFIFMSYISYYYLPNTNIYHLLRIKTMTDVCRLHGALNSQPPEHHQISLSFCILYVSVYAVTDLYLFFQCSVCSSGCVAPL